MNEAEKMAETVLAKIDGWDRCWPGNIYIQGTMEDAAATIRAQAAEIERLKVALKPFVDCAEYLEADTTGFHDDDCLTLVAGEEQFALWHDLNHGDFRRARAALKPKP